MANDKQRLLAGEPYLAGAEDLVADRRHARLLTERLNATGAAGAADPERRRTILGELLGSLGEQSEILSPFACDYGYQISVGARTFINFGAVILDSAPVSIGDDVQIGPGVHLVTPSHPLDAAERRTGLEWGAPITIDDDAWLATGVIVCPGVAIGAGCVIGAGSVVTRDMPPGYLCFGNPCRPVRAIP
jgi:maltose O-acetyltransferase